MLTAASELERAEIVLLYANGYSVKRLKEEYGRGWNTITAMIRDAGFETMESARPEKRRKIMADDIIKINQLRLQLRSLKHTIASPDKRQKERERIHSEIAEIYAAMPMTRNQLNAAAEFNRAKSRKEAAKAEEETKQDPFRPLVANLDKVIGMVEEGTPAEVIGALFDVEAETVTKFIDRYQIGRREERLPALPELPKPSEQSNTEWVVNNLSRIEEWTADGYSALSIAKALNVHHHYIQRAQNGCYNGRK